MTEAARIRDSVRVAIYRHYKITLDTSHRVEWVGQEKTE
jgi:hypothetical protein